MPRPPIGTRPTTLLSILILLSGCNATTDGIESASTQTNALADPGLLAAPRAVSMPAGSSFAVVRLEATPDDWVEFQDDTWLFLGYE